MKRRGVKWKEMKRVELRGGEMKGDVRDGKERRCQAKPFGDLPAKPPG